MRKKIIKIKRIQKIIVDRGNPITGSSFVVESQEVEWIEEVEHNPPPPRNYQQKHSIPVRSKKNTRHK